MKRTRRAPRIAVLAAALLPLALGACSAEPVSLADVLDAARGEVAGADGRPADVGDLLAAARGRPVSVSFAYVGCGGRTPRIERLRGAAGGDAAGDTLHIVLNAVDAPARYADLVRDLTGRDALGADADAVRVVFVRRGDLEPREPNPTVEAVMAAMGMRYGRERFVESVNGIGLFDRNGAFLGIRY
jgi:hypothetical protein